MTSEATPNLQSLRSGAAGFAGRGLDLPEGWKWAELGTAAEFVNGDRGKNYPKQSDRVACGVPFVNAGHIDANGRLNIDRMDYISRECFDRLRNGKLRTGDMVYCLRGAIGKTARVDFAEGTIASSLVIVRATERACRDYLYFYLTSPLGQQLVRQNDNGSAQPNLSVRVLSRYPLPLPPLPEQRRIAAVLGALDDKIELNRKMNRTLEEMAQALFKSWFIHFDGHDDLVDSELGPIPRGWRVGVVADLGTVVTGKTPPTKTPENYGDLYPFIKIPDMHGNVWASRTSTALSATGHATQSKKLLPAKAVCVSCIATPGLVVLTRRPSHTNQQINSLVLREDETCAWAYHAMRTLGRMIIARASGGSVTKNLNKGQFSKLPLCVPPVGERRRFQTVVGPILDRIAANDDESDTLADLRDTLLPKLISGELRVPEAEEMAEASL